MDEALDPFRITDKLENPLLEVMVSRLEVRGKHGFFQKVLRDYLDAMDIDSAGTVLDMGCGTGVATRTIARRADFSGRVTGIDLSPYLARTAKRLADEEGLGSRVEFRSGDTRELDIPDGRFDAVVAHTLVSHVAEALTVIKEAGRVVKPGGLIAVFDGDYASMTFALDDPLQSKKYDEALINALVTSPRIMRRDRQMGGCQSLIISLARSRCGGTADCTDRSQSRKRAPAIATTLRRGLNNPRNNETLDPVSRPGKTPHRPVPHPIQYVL